MNVLKIVKKLKLGIKNNLYFLIKNLCGLNIMKLYFFWNHNYIQNKPLGKLTNLHLIERFFCLYNSMFLNKSSLDFKFWY